MNQIHLIWLIVEVEQTGFLSVPEMSPVLSGRFSLDSQAEGPFYSGKGKTIKDTERFHGQGQCRRYSLVCSAKVKNVIYLFSMALHLNL